MTATTGVAARLETLRGRVHDACRDAGRDPRAVTLVAVSKTVARERIEEALAAGQRAFGENRVQEASAKWPALRERHPDVELHLVGPLQTNKARDAVALFDVIHSVDRPALCDALARQSERQGRRPQLFVQVNTGAEPQKAGVLPEHADELLRRCRYTPALDVVGVMCIPPVGEPPGPHFALAAAIAARHALPCLSMGMSGDYAEAIAHGATHVRVGTGIFGARPAPAARPV